jgi:hypothetical protein
MADETRVQVLKEDGRAAETDSYMWVYRSGEDGLPPIILFNYTETKKGKNAAGFLDGYKGYLMTDGYSGYNLLSNVKRCCCWAHIRRYFIDAVPKGHEYDMSIPAVQGVEFCSKLFHLEKQFTDKGHSPEKRKNERLLKEKPIVEAFFTWLDTQVITRNDRFHKAVQYAQNRRPYLSTYLEDGRCSLSNNLTENTIRPFTIGRKGWLFCDTPKGAEASAIVYSFVEMAKANNLNINQYLTHLLSKLPSCDLTDPDFDQLLPWHEDVQSKFKNE